TSNKVENFFGVPYADPPVGDLRLRQPRPLSKPLGTFDATSSPRLCTQKIMAGDLPILDTWPESISGSLRAYNSTSNNQGEDCLTVNIQRPVDTKPDAKLPVIFWIFGGVFEQGSTNSSDWSTMVIKSIEQGGVIIVAVNYRLNTFGFLGGEELQAEGATNLGLRDQRLGLEWVHDNIAAFGGDPDKVTLWGQSAGSISTYSHLLINNGDNRSDRTGKPLFRAAIMDSGTSFDAEPVNGTTAQAQYDYIVSAVGCASSYSTLDCLRAAPWQKTYDATNTLPKLLSQDGFSIDYLPRPDLSSPFFTSAKLTPGVNIVDVPIIVAHQEDEATIFLQPTSSVNTTAKLIEMVHKQFPTTPTSIFETLVSYYTNNTSYGAPFRTNATQDVTYPHSKINSAVVSDVAFIFQARSFLDTIAGPHPSVNWSSPVYALQGSYFYGTPIVGSFHGSDL
ncbi:alpha/beta-hydrolase, partial [Periconia macrospinosa]